MACNSCNSNGSKLVSGKVTTKSNGVKCSPKTQAEQLEDQIDYSFVQRIIQEITQSCAMALPIPASAIPPLILQAAQYFWENYDFAIEERYYCLPFREFQHCGPNNLATLPQRVMSVFGVYKLNDSFNYGTLGDFSLERMILNNAALASGVGGTLSDVYGTGNTGYNLTDITAALYEVQTFQAMFDAPLTFNYNMYSHKLVILGALGHADILLQTYIRCKIQDLYQNYYFFRWCVCLALRSLGTILGTFEFKLPGGITLNYSTFREQANTEMAEITEWIKNQNSSDYFFMTNTI